MAQAEFGTGKSLVVLAIVLGCFTILWPKIFYPMMQTAFALTSPKSENDNSFKETDRPPHLHPGSINPRLVPEDVQDKFHMREGRPFPHPQARQPMKSQPKSGGAMSIIMPIYTVGIIVFFLYTVLKLVFKKPSDGEKKPMVKDFHMDPEYRKFVCQQSTQDIAKVPEEKPVKKEKSSANPENSGQELDEKDYEIYKLKKKLEETEQAMERIMKHMGAMSACLSERFPVDKLQGETDTALPKKSDSKVSKQKNVKNGENDDPSDHESCKQLQDDLAKLIKSSKVEKHLGGSTAEQSPNPDQNVEESSSEEDPESFESEGDSSHDEADPIPEQDNDSDKRNLLSQDERNNGLFMRGSRRKVHQ